MAVEVKISVDDFVKKTESGDVNSDATKPILDAAKRAKPDVLLSFKDQDDLDKALASIGAETTKEARLAALKKFLNAKLEIQETATAAATAVVADAARTAEAKKTVDELLGNLGEAPDATKVEALIKIIDEDKTLTPEAKRVNYFKIIHLTLFAKGFGYRFDLQKVTDKDGKIDEERTKAIAKIPSGEFMFATYTYLIGIFPAAKGEPKRLVEAIVNGYNQKNSSAKMLFTQDKAQNLQIIHNSGLSQPEKAWLLSYVSKPESIVMKPEDISTAGNIHGASQKADAEIRNAVEKETGIKDAFNRPAAEYAKDPSLYMTDAVRALGPTGIAAGVFALIFSKWIFSNSWTGFDLVAKLGGAFFGLKLAGKLGLGEAIHSEATGKTRHVKDAASATVSASKEAMDWSWAKIKAGSKIIKDQSESAAQQAMIWFYMSNYTVNENGNKVSFTDAKVSTLNGLDPTSVSSLGIQKKNGAEKVELSDLSKAKSIIEELKNKRLTNLIAGGKTPQDAQAQLNQEMANMNLIEFTVKANEVVSAPVAVAPTQVNTGNAQVAGKTPVTQADVDAAKAQLNGGISTTNAPVNPTPSNSNPKVTQADVDAAKNAFSSK